MPRPPLRLLPLPLLAALATAATVAAAPAPAPAAATLPREITSVHDLEQGAGGASGAGGGGGVAARISARVAPTHAAAAPRLPVPLPTPQEIEAIRKVAQILAMLGQQVIPAIIGESPPGGGGGGALVALPLPALTARPPASAQSLDDRYEPVDDVIN